MSYTQDHLAQAERHVARGERFVRFQRMIVARDMGLGSSTEKAEAWLALLETGLAKHVLERDRIAAALSSRFP